MESEGNLPFKVGDLAEAKTFEQGFRGAWFRCKITDITKREGRLVYALEYYDFPDEALEYLRVYQVPPYSVGDAKQEHRELMLRPQYPPICNKKQMPHVSEISEVTVVVNNTWKVGDLVEWCSHDSFWCGRIKRLLGYDKAKIELKQPPLGEGSDYDAFLKDVRPSLDWSLEHGWTVPMPTQKGGSPCARIMKPANQDQVGRIQIDIAIEGSARSSAQCPSGSSNSAVSGKVSTGTAETLKQSEEEEEKCTGQGSKTSEDIEASGSDCEEFFDMDEAVMELEKSLKKVKWLKQIMHGEISSSAGEKPESEWEFLLPKKEPPSED